MLRNAIIAVHTVRLVCLSSSLVHLALRMRLAPLAMSNDCSQSYASTDTCTNAIQVMYVPLLGVAVGLHPPYSTGETWDTYCSPQDSS